jgi:hypothetical protein
MDFQPMLPTSVTMPGVVIGKRQVNASVGGSGQTTRNSTPGGVTGSWVLTLTFAVDTHPDVVLSGFLFGVLHPDQLSGTTRKKPMPRMNRLHGYPPT